VTGLWFSQGIPVSSNNKTDRHVITKILLKVALKTINQQRRKIRRRKKFQLHQRPQKCTGMPSAPFSTNDAHRV
jgi:hypothetical protein